MHSQKSVLRQSRIDFLGHWVTSAGIKEYLELLNFYRRFVPHAAEMLPPLYELVNLKDGDIKSAWTSCHTEHSQRSKDALAAATCLAHPSLTAETSISTDASDTAVGAVFRQRLDGVWTPISFFSRKLHAAETLFR